MQKPDNNPDKRPKNREVENEMIRKPEKEHQPPKPATEPKKPQSDGTA